MSADQGRRDCACDRAEPHQHGTYGGYDADGCRCAQCRAFWSRRLKLNHHLVRTQGKNRPDRVMPMIGVARRLQALTAIGYSCRQLAPLLGAQEANVRMWRRNSRPFITTRNHQKVARLYDELWDKPSTHRYRRRALNEAAAHGWRPPMDLDDDRLDDPDYDPPPLPRPSWDQQPCGTPAAARRHRRKGEHVCRACITAETRARTEARRRRKAA